LILVAIHTARKHLCLSVMWPTNDCLLSVLEWLMLCQQCIWIEYFHSRISVSEAMNCHLSSFIHCCMCSNRKLHEIAAYLNLVTPPTDDADDVYGSEFLLELLVIIIICTVSYRYQSFIRVWLLVFSIVLYLTSQK